MTKTICLDKKYSTTQLLTNENSLLVAKPEDKFETLLFLPEGESRNGEGGLRTKGYLKKTFDNKPLISIITVVYNGEKYLEQTIQSVINQNYDNVEYIIIDGGSTDRTVDLIKKYEDKIDYWVSEKDSGIYDAMNKGLELVSGEWINFMNAGDSFCDKSILQETVSTYLFQQKYDIVFGYVKMIDEEHNYLGYRHPYKHLEECDFLKDNCVAHQAAFTHKKVFEQIGKFSCEYQVQGDYDFWLRAKKIILFSIIYHLILLVFYTVEFHLIEITILKH
ncbi:glycosyltransferase family 2 protein [Sulfurovum sp. AR]|uniref:glycosyltransferase family 2 protein n=1 Tax=Sulfurovum sp. AR TaxID=1165841 RepID=UPI00025C4EBB|nr:glycosyltransferase family 2 protein [Sulfurovum sp. AR]EIF50097.1 family 2 glycosyl transferase [Sulfurovum sp. AR]